MSKRSLPEGEQTTSQQLKTHVREKEVNEGVKSEEKMQEVYEKTLNIMMEGAKKLAEQEKEAEKEAEMAEEEKKDEEKEEAENPDILPGQTYLELTEGGVPKIAGVYEEASEIPNGKHVPECTEEKKDEEKAEDEPETSEQGAGDNADAEEKPVQKTTLADVGFNLDGVKSSPKPSPAKESCSPKHSPVKLVKRPLEIQ